MEAPTGAGPPGAQIERDVRGGADAAGNTIPSREFRLLIQGLQAWCGPPPVGGARGSLGILIGEAGSGKSILLDALESALAALGIRSRRASCFKEKLPLEPIRALLGGVLKDILRARPEGKAPASRLSAGTIEPFAPELRRLLPELAWPKPIEPFPALDPELDRIRICDTLAQTFAEIAREEPLVLLLEDLQWIDPLSRDILVSLLEIVRLRAARPPSPRVLVVASLRPRQGEGIEPLLDPRFRAFDVDLRGYSREDVRDCAVAAGVNLPLTLREALHRGTAGNALQIRFFLSGLHPGEDALLSGLPEDPARAADFFEKAVLSRLWDLAEDEIEAVRLLAGLGRPYPAGFVQELIATAIPRERSHRGGDEAGASAGTLARLLEEGWVRRSVCEDGAPAWGIAGEPIASIVEDSLSTRERVRIHRVLAEAHLDWIARTGAPSLSGFGLTPFGRAFHHLSQATGHPRRVEIGLLAAREMEALSANLEAMEVLERLLEGLDPEEDEARWIEIGEKLADHLEMAGAHSEAIEIARKILGAPRKSRCPEERARILRKIGNLHGRLGEMKLQVDCYAEGLAILEGTRDSLERLKLYAHLARIFMEMGDLPECLRYLEESLKFTGHDDLTKDREYLEIYGLAEEVNYRRGEYVEALSFEERIYKNSQASGNWLQTIRSAGRIGHLYFLRGDAAQARRHFLLALDRATASGNRFLQARSLAKIGRLHRSLGETREAIEVLSRARDIYEELVLREEAAGLKRSLVQLHLTRHDFPAAAAAFRDHATWGPLRAALEIEASVFPPVYPDRKARSLEIERLKQRLSGEPQVGEARGRAVLAGDLAELFLDEGKQAEAARLLEEMLRGSEFSKSPAALALMLQRAGRIHRVLGERARALQCFERSLECLGAEPLRPGPEKALLANAYLEVGSIYLVQGEGGKAYDCLLRGLQLFVDLESEQGFAIAVLKMAEFLQEIGVREEAAVFAGAVADLCQGTHFLRWEAQAHLLRGTLASRSGDFGESQRSFRKARQAIDSLGLPAEGARLELELGWERYRRGNYPEALRTAREGIEASRELGMQDTLDEFLFLLGAVESTLANKKKNFLRALELLNQALLGAQGRSRPLFEAQILQAIALIYEDRGKGELGRDFRVRANSITERLLSRLPPGIREAAERARGIESFDT